MTRHVMKCMYSKKEGILEIQVISQEQEQEDRYGSAFANILGILHTQSMIFHHPKTFADFSAASFNACLGSLTPK